MEDTAPKKVSDKQSIAPLFAGWEETMIWSCLQDCMGVAYADDLNHPQSAQIITGGFCFFGGKADEGIIQNSEGLAFVMVPPDEHWEKAIEREFGHKVSRQIRYATKKEPDVFARSKLKGIVETLPAPYELRMIDREVYGKIMSSRWAVDLCVNFESCEDFIENGLGVVLMNGEEILSGASSYTYYRGGIEIEIDTREDQRRKGFALACGARLMLECLARNRYPSWDAHNLGSLALAQKLGYHFEREYPVYEFI